MRKELLADIAIYNSGCIRADKKYKPGYLTAGDFVDIYPFRLFLAKVRATGQQLLNILEDGVSMYPALEGRFPQVSGIKFKFDASRPKYQRVIQESIEILGKKFSLDQEYAIATTNYLSGEKMATKVFLSASI